jgi:Flp pilus assembly protein TadG
MTGRLSSRATAPPHGDADRGALSLSYAVILPIVLLFIMIVIQASFWYLARQAALAAARQGADAARVVGGSAEAGRAAALAFAQHSGAGYLIDPSASTGGSTPSTVAVTVTGHVPTFVPGLVVHVSETAQAPVEEFQP